MDESKRLRTALVSWAAGGPGAGEAAREAGLLAREGVRTVVLVEGASDRAALEALAARRGRDLEGEGVVVVPLGGATSIGRFLDVCGPPGLDLPLAGLCDVGEERHFRRHLERVGLGTGLTREGLEALGFFVCDADLEDELIRALGNDGVERVIEDQGEGRAYQTFRNQPVQREWSVDRRLRRFMGTHSGRKAQYARALVERLEADRVPEPLVRLLDRVGRRAVPAPEG
ncbi:TOPRIM nucleotidyl transferase/hydrolase domain-containing protein [Streptomyces sp. NPDC001941]|uniref:TOPRIM nucleotidyl transferase/hydrolase domain-containing protein n=1 Tax=Streptomyces sp. NPDC001941 TaxID=3154659 RepID=UPI0033190947